MSQHQMKVFLFRLEDKQMLEKLMISLRVINVFFKKDLWRHKKKCPALVPGEKPIKHARNTNLLFMCPDSSSGDDIFTIKLLNSMKSDIIALLCRQDKTILEFGRGLFSKAQGLAHQYQYIKHRMREMA